MYLTDDEIIAILLKEKKRKRRRRRVLRRLTCLAVFILILILGIGLFINRGVLDTPFNGRGVIFIDPGHGGVDGGSTALGRKEKDDTLALSLVVKEELEEMGFKVYMSRTDDSDVDRAERGKMANNKHAKLMISIHRNQDDKSEGEGVEIWIPSDNNKESRLLGENIISELEKQGFYNRGVRSGTLVNSKDDYYENSVPTMPSCIVETGFVSKASDNKLFDSKLKENGKAIAKAIEKTFASLYETEE